MLFKRPFCFLVLFFFLIHISCSKAIKDPELKQIISIEMNEIVDATIRATIKAEIFNHNSFGGTVKKIDADIIIDGMKVGKIVDKNVHEFKGNASSIISINTSFDLPSFSKIFDSLIKKDKCKVLMKGKATAGMGLVFVPININNEAILSIKKELDKVMQEKLSKNTIKIKGVGLKKISFSKSDVNIKISFLNDLGLDYTIKKFDFKIYSQGESKSFGKGALTKEVFVKKNSKEEIQTRICFTNTETVKQVFSVFTGKKFIAKGTASIEIKGYLFEIPVRQILEN